MDRLISECRDNGLLETITIIEDDQTGVFVSERFENLMDSLSEEISSVKMVIVANPSQITTNVNEFYQILNWFKENEIELRFL